MPCISKAYFRHTPSHILLEKAELDHCDRPNVDLIHVEGLGLKRTDVQGLSPCRHNMVKAMRDYQTVFFLAEQVAKPCIAHKCMHAIEVTAGNKQPQSKMNEKSSSHTYTILGLVRIYANIFSMRTAFRQTRKLSV